MRFRVGVPGCGDPRLKSSSLSALQLLNPNPKPYTLSP